MLLLQYDLPNGKLLNILANKSVWPKNNAVNTKPVNVKISLNNFTISLVTSNGDKEKNCMENISSNCYFVESKT